MPLNILHFKRKGAGNMTISKTWGGVPADLLAIGLQLTVHDSKHLIRLFHLKQHCVKINLSS